MDFKKTKERIENIIRKYLSLQDRVEVLSASSRLTAKEDAAKLSIEAGELHTQLQDIIETQLFWTKTDGLNRIQNRTEIAKILGFCRELGIPRIYVADGGFYVSFDFQNDFEISLEGEDHKLQLTMKLMEIVSINSVHYQSCESANLDAPSTELASSKLKEFAKKFGYKLKSYVTGSFHEQFGVVCVDFKSKES